MTRPNGIPLFAEADNYSIGPSKDTPTKVDPEALLVAEGFYKGGVNSPQQVNDGQHLIGRWIDYASEVFGIYAQLAISFATGSLAQGTPILLWMQSSEGGIELNDPQPGDPNDGNPVDPLNPPDNSTHVKFPAPGIYKVAFNARASRTEPADPGAAGWAITAYNNTISTPSVLFDISTVRMNISGNNPEMISAQFAGFFLFTVTDIETDLLTFARSLDLFISSSPLQFFQGHKYAQISIQRIQ